MIRARQEQGYSILSILLILIMVGFYVMCIIKLAPAYFEYFTIKEVVTKTADQFDPQTDTVADVRRKIDNLFNMNQVRGMLSKEVEVYRKDGETIIDANHEVRVPIMGRIDAVMKFDDLELVAGQRRLD